MSGNSLNCVYMDAFKLLDAGWLPPSFEILSDISSDEHTMKDDPERKMSMANSGSRSEATKISKLKQKLQFED